MREIYFNGIENLSRLINGKKNTEVIDPKEIAKHIVHNAIFFHPSIVEKRCKELAKHINAGESVPARWSSKEGVYGDNAPKTKKDATGVTLQLNTRPSINIKIDKDGNDAVRQLIHKKTGLWVSCGSKNSHIKNYTISHVWGQAWDPIYFTSLWNIVLVPTYCNFVLDKNGDSVEEGNIDMEIVKCCKDTMKAVCWKLYGDIIKDFFKSINIEVNDNLMDGVEVAGLEEWIEDAAKNNIASFNGKGPKENTLMTYKGQKMTSNGLA